MAAVAIHVVPDDNFDDWVVRADMRRNSANTPAEKPPNGSRRRSRKSARPNSLSASRTEKNEPNAFCKKLGREIVPAMIRRNRATPCYTFMPSTCSRVHASS
jgi:hypothetical protein